MRKIASLAVIPLCAGFLWAQDTKTETTTTKTTYNGNLMDAGCLTKQTTTDENSTTTKTQTTSEVVDCPVTTTTTTFALRTPDGKYVRFDDPSNTRLVEVVKGNKVWSRSINDHKPLRVRVVGTPNGDVVVMESIR